MTDEWVRLRSACVGWLMVLFCVILTMMCLRTIRHFGDTKERDAPVVAQSPFNVESLRYEELQALPEDARVMWKDIESGVILGQHSDHYRSALEQADRKEMRERVEVYYFSLTDAQEGGLCASWFTGLRV